MSVLLFIKCILIAGLITICLGILLLYVNDVKIFNRPKVGDIWQKVSIDPFDENGKQVVILKIKKNKYGDLWVEYVICGNKYNSGPYTEKWELINKLYSKKVNRISEHELEDLVKKNKINAVCI